MMNRRDFLSSGLLATSSPWSLGAEPRKAASTRGGEPLYNGITLPSSWPPQGSNLTLQVPSTPFYLTKPPDVVLIDVGRQLFVDDFLIEQTTLQRTFHQPEYHPASPLIRPEHAWEKQGDYPMAAVYSDGVWYDPADELFKMWYMGGYRACTCYAISQDGIRWEKPKLDVQAGTNIVSTRDRDSTTVWLDHEDPNPKQRFKLFRAHREMNDGKVSWFFEMHVSADGIHWGDVVAKSSPIYPRSTVFRNPFRKLWEFSLRKDSSREVGRCRRYYECGGAVAEARWEMSDRSWWIGADTLDIPREDTKFRPQLTNLDGVAYESVVLGLFSLWRGAPPAGSGRPELNDVCLGFSRDGFHFHRPDRRPFLAMSEQKGDWNWGNVQSAGGGCVIVGDKLHFYCSGRSGSPENPEAGGSTGLAILRRDGFASLDAGEASATITTRPVQFTGLHLFVNLEANDGELRAEILDARGQAIAPFTLENSVTTSGDSTKKAVVWKGVDDLLAVANKPVRFRFHLKKGRLFAFWVSPTPKGTSRGFVAAGGPAYANHRDD